VSSLVVQTSFLGDIVLTTPLIRELAGRGPVDVLTTPEGSTILGNNPNIRNLIVYDRRECDSGLAGFGRTVGRIRHAGAYGSVESATRVSGASGGYDSAYLAQGSLRSAMLVTAAGIKRRVGFNTSEGRRFYTERVDYRAERHHAERLWWLSNPSFDGAPTADRISPELFPTADDDHAAATVLRDQLLDKSRPFIALAPGSVWATKRWPFYPELAVRIAREFNVVVVGGGADVAIGDTIVSQLPKGCAANAAGRLGFLSSAALIGRAVALVTNDSAPQHIASAMNTPTLTIFGPTVPEFGFGPLAPGSSISGMGGLACRPCDRHGPQRCPLGHWRCMRELSSAEVFGLLTQTLSQASSV
jgi:heptosyltransferase-2